MVIKQARIRESKKRDTALEHKLLMAKLEPLPDGEDTSHVSVTVRDWQVEVERLIDDAIARLGALEHKARPVKRK